MSHTHPCSGPTSQLDTLTRYCTSFHSLLYRQKIPAHCNISRPKCRANLPAALQVLRGRGLVQLQAAEPLPGFVIRKYSVAAAAVLKVAAATKVARFRNPSRPAVRHQQAKPTAPTRGDEFHMPSCAKQAGDEWGGWTDRVLLCCAPFCFICAWGWWGGSSVAPAGRS